MINQDYAYVRERWMQFWTMENHDRPLISVCAPKDGAVYTPVKAPDLLLDRWTDMDSIIAGAREWMKNTYYGGEAFPALFPNLGPDLLGAICGCGIEFGEDTSWAIHVVKDWVSYPEIVFDPQNQWWKQIYSMTKRLVEDAQGDYLVGITDLHPGTDGLVSLRGPQELCLDLFDCPEHILPRSRQIFEVYKAVYSRLASLISTCQEGSTNWMNIWHPEADWYVVSSDFSCLVGEDQYEEYIAGAIEEEIAFLHGSMYHLDGTGALHHLDRILRLKGLDGVQWVQGEGAPPAREWLEVYRRIQAAGKRIQAICEPADIEPLCRELDPEGVHLTCYAASEKDARELLEIACKASAARRRRAGL